MSEPYSVDLQGRPISTYAYEQATVSTTALNAANSTNTLGTLANWAGCKRLIVTVQAAAVRVRVDSVNGTAGAAPTATVGTPYEVGAQFVLFGPDIDFLRVIRRDGADAVLNLEYSR